MQVPKRRGLVLTIVGAVLMLLIAPAAAGVGIWKGVSGGMNVVNNSPWIQPGGTVQLSGDTTDETILVEGRYDSSETLPSCRVTGPDGQQITVDEGTTRLSMDWGGTAYSRAGTFEAARAGDYKIDCSGHRTKVLNSSVADDIARRVLVPLGIGVGLGVLAFLVGVVLLIVGIVKLVRSGQERARAKAAAAGWPGYAPGYPPQPPPPGPGNPDDPYRR